MKKIIYATIISALLSETIPSINLGWFHLSIFRVSFILMSLGYFLEVFKTRNYNRGTKIFNKLNYSLSFMIIWLLFAIISIFWVKDYLSWLKTIFFISIGTFSSLVFTKHLKDIGDITMILRLLTPIILIHNFLGWSEIITGNYFFLADNRFDRYLRYRHPVSIFGNTNDFALLLMFALFFSLINLLNSKSYKEKTLYLALMISSVGLIYYSGSRLTVFGIILAAIVGFILKWRESRITNTKKGPLVLIYVTLLMILIFVLTYSPLSNNLASYFKQFDNGVNSFSIRLNLMKNAWSFFIKTYGMGVGSGNIEFWMEHYQIYNTAGVLSLHNWWLEILVAYGIGIFIMYVGFYFKLIYDMAKQAIFSEDLTVANISFGMTLALIAFITGSISPSSNIKLTWMWIFMSIIIAVQNIILKQRDSK